MRSGTYKETFADLVVLSPGNLTDNAVVFLGTGGGHFAASVCRTRPQPSSPCRPSPPSLS